MAVELVMPRLSASMQEGTLASWLVGDGQPVAQGQPIAEIETDLATVAYAAPEGGVVRILVPEGSRLLIGEPIGLIDDLTPLPGGHSVAPPGAGFAPTGAALPPRQPGEPGPTDSYELLEDHHAAHTVHASVPPPADAQRSPAWGSQQPWDAVYAEGEEGETTDFAALDVAAGWEGDDEYEDPATEEHPVVAPPQAPSPWVQPTAHQPQAGVPQAAPQPAPAPAPPVPSPAEAAGERFTPDELIAPPTLPPRPPEQRPAPANAGAGSRVHASPVARRLADELGLDLASIQGTGPDGRVTRTDIETAQAAGMARPPVQPSAMRAAPSEFTPPTPAGPPPPIPVVEPAPVVEPTPEPVAEVVVEPIAPVPAPEPVAPAPEPEPEPQVVAEPDFVAAIPAQPTPEAQPEPVAEPEPEPAPEPEAVREEAVLPAAQPGGGRGEPRVIELSRQQQNVARRVAESRATIPDFHVRVEVDAEPMLALREELVATRPDLSAPSINDLVVRAAGLALRAHPRLNGAFRDGRVEEYPRINIGITVEHEGTLTVPVIQDADRLSLGQLAERSAALTTKAHAGELRPADLASATFTVANLGMFGVDEFTAVITPGQAAMLTVGAVAARPVVRGGQVVPGRTIVLTAICDHRGVYGTTAASFVARIRQLLEHPTALLA